MPRKGTVNNPKGRPKGSLNKRTVLLRKQVADVMDKNFIESIQQLDKLPLKDRLNMLAKFMPFSIPRYHTVDIIKEMQEERLQQEDHDRTLSEIFKRVLTDEQKKQIEIEYLRYIQEQASKAANGQ